MAFFSRFLGGGARRNAAPAHRSEAEMEKLKGTLIARRLTKSYRGRQVVNGVSFGVRAGEAVGILGPNGAGKTTCFYMVTGLVPVDSGTIEIDGFDVTTMPMYRRARLGIGYLPQEASIFRGLSVENNIKAILEVSEKNKKKRMERARRAARGVPHQPSAQGACTVTLRRRAAAAGDRARPCIPAELHAARRTLRRRRPDRRFRHPASGQASDRSAGSAC